MLVREQRRVAPRRLAIAPPVAAERPPRQLLARIPLALTEVDEPAVAIMLAQPPQQIGREQPLRRPERRRVPFGAVTIVRRHERRLSAHRQPDIALRELAIDLLAHRDDRVPLRVGIRLRDARRFVDALHRHLVRELDFAVVDGAGDGRGARRLGRARQRNVTFAREQTGSGVEADPAGAGQIDFAPRVQVGEVAGRAFRAVERGDVGHELNQVAGHESRRQPEMTHQLHEQPRRIAARSAAQFERLLLGLHARIEPDDIADVALHLAIQLDQEVDRPLRLARDAGEIRFEARRQRLLTQVRLQLLKLPVFVGERCLLRVRFEKEIERVVHRHLGDQVDFDAQLVDFFGESQPGNVVALRILLPVEEVIRRRDAQGVRDDRRPAMRRRTKAHELRRESDQPIVAIGRDMMKRDVNGHARLWHPCQHGRVRDAE